MTVEPRLVNAVADATVDRLVRRTIRYLQRMKELLSGDSGLVNVWDEVCVQIQDEQSVLWDAYDSTVRALVESVVRDLTSLEREAVWLQTDRGSAWYDGRDTAHGESDSEDAMPVTVDDVVEHVVHELYNRAANWSNARIRHHIESRFEMDD